MVLQYRNLVEYMRDIKTPTKRMRIWSFNLENAINDLKKGEVTDYSINILEEILRQMKGKDNE